jgi:hypothetical protein
MDKTLISSLNLSYQNQGNAEGTGSGFNRRVFSKAKGYNKQTQLKKPAASRRFSKTTGCARNEL